MKAKDLQPGQQFKRKGQRKWRTAKTVIVLTARNGTPIELVGKLLIVLNDCRQWALDPETELILNENQMAIMPNNNQNQNNNELRNR